VTELHSRIVCCVSNTFQALHLKWRYLESFKTDEFDFSWQQTLLSWWFWTIKFGIMFQNRNDRQFFIMWILVRESENVCDVRVTQKCGYCNDVPQYSTHKGENSMHNRHDCIRFTRLVNSSPRYVTPLQFYNLFISILTAVSKLRGRFLSRCSHYTEDTWFWLGNVGDVGSFFASYKELHEWMTCVFKNFSL